MISRYNINVLKLSDTRPCILISNYIDYSKVEGNLSLCYLELCYFRQINLLRSEIDEEKYWLWEWS